MNNLGTGLLILACCILTYVTHDQLKMLNQLHLNLVVAQERAYFLGCRHASLTSDECKKRSLVFKTELKKELGL